MSWTILLRFRDLVEPTIPQHERVIRDAGAVWWGWWRKPNEPRRLEELGRVRALATKSGLTVGLFDRSTMSFFRANAVDCVYSESGEFISSPDTLTTPEYYHTAKVPAWIRLNAIDSVSMDAFVREFGGIPVQEDTLVPIELPSGERGPERRNVVEESGRLRGSVVLHLSDLHFGADFGFPAVAGPGSFPLLDLLADDVTRTAGGQVGLLVVSGDITSRGDASHLFNTGKPFLHELRKRLGLEPGQVVIVPGNHDVPFKDFALTYDHEEAFNDFVKIFYGSARPQLQLLRFVLPSGRPVEFLTINSVKLRTTETSNYGWIDWQTCERLLEAAPERDPATLRVAVMHHHLVGAPKEEPLPDPEYSYGSISVTLNAGAVTEGLQKHGFRIVVHGHQHTPAIIRVGRGRRRDGSLALDGFEDGLYLIAGGSAGAAARRIQGEVRDNTYGLLSVSDGSVDVRVRAFNPTGVVRDLYSARLPIG